MRIVSAVVVGALIAGGTVPFANAAQTSSPSAASALVEEQAARAYLDESYPTLSRLVAGDVSQMPQAEAAALVRKLEETGELRRFIADERFGSMRATSFGKGVGVASAQATSIGWKERILATAIMGAFKAAGLSVPTIIYLTSNTARFLNWCSSNTICAGIAIGVPVAVVTQVLTYIRERYQSRRVGPSQMAESFS